MHLPYYLCNIFFHNVSPWATQTLDNCILFMQLTWIEIAHMCGSHEMAAIFHGYNNVIVIYTINHFYYSANEARAKDLLEQLSPVNMHTADLIDGIYSSQINCFS